MTKHNHTPGPWIASEPYCGDEWYFGHGKEIIVNGSGKQFVCVLGGNDEEDVATARLIAAAPELLDALKLAEAFLSVQKNPADFYVLHGHYLPLMRAAIAKATGGDQ